MRHLVYAGIALAALLFSLAPHAMEMPDDPLLVKGMLHQAEHRFAPKSADEPVQTWDFEAWAGYDLTKLWFLSHGEAEDGEYAHSEQQLRLARAVTAYWEAYAGWRVDDDRHHGDQHWLAVGLQGLAPYYWDSDIALYADGDGNSQLRLESEYEFMITQRWVLVPDVELTINGSDRPDEAEESGVSLMEAGLRLRYEFAPELGPYIGVHHEQSLGQTADLRRAAGEETRETRWLVGFSAWF